MLAAEDVVPFVLYVLVGLGTGWTANDSLWSEVPIFIGKFAAGFSLPSQLTTMGQVVGAVALLGFIVLRRCGGSGAEQPSAGREWQRKVIWGALMAQLLCCALLTAAWDVLVADVPVVLFVVMGIAAVVGMLNSVVVLPFVSTRCSPMLVSAVSTGVQTSSMLAGLLGIAQLPRGARPPTFSVGLFFAFFTLIVAVSAAAWFRVSSRDVGLGADGGTELQVVTERSAEPKSDPPYWLFLTILPLDIVTWGFAPSILPFAATATAGDCDASNPHTVEVLRYAISMSFVALPLAALTSNFVPTSSQRTITMITLVGLLAFCLETSALVHLASGLWGDRQAPLRLVLYHFVLRFTDTYVVTTAFRIISESYVNVRLREKYSEMLGVLANGSCLVSTLVAFVLVKKNVIQCATPTT